jgi:hypothetical protein
LGLRTKSQLSGLSASTGWDTRFPVVHIWCTRSNETLLVLSALPHRGEIPLVEALLTPLLAGGKENKGISGEDQAVPFSPAGVPGALPDQRRTEHCLREEDQAGYDTRRQQRQLPAVYEGIPSRRECVDERAHCGQTLQ